ncbi:hypothetical protein DUI87_30349 [Hirundo rustica rustica]|uniref:Myopalladin n=1 Tax=Hirundo rustica rustica TaxID=333673 RepID=A0A3M0IWQ2_HIRRU|nr:hypothetical protein DUI87_30349 [Hirundo rustica rustica]
MQDDSLETSTSISQLLRESYLAETKHQGKSERSRSEPVSQNFHYGNASGDSDEVAAQDDLPDLSAFLSQEELDESVNLARQAIDQNPLETKQDELQAHPQHPPDQLNNTGKHKQMAQSTALKTSDNSLHSNFCQEHITNTKGSKASSQDLKKHHLPSESESKKEFLNKAADFIEELSSLFKAHNSERIRPRTCKNYKSKIDSKNKSAQKGSSSLSLASENRERLSILTPQDLENKPGKTLEQTDDQQAANLESISQLTSAELKTESESASVYSDEPIGQPPRFTQKLKSREVPEGSKVQLDCIVVGIPAPEVRWYCEGKELENSPDIQIIQTGDRHSLIIVEAFEEDTGRYSCFASNIYGTDSTSAEIYIEGISSSDSEGEIIKDEMDHKPKAANTSVNAASPAVRTATKHQETSKAPPAVVQPVSVPVQAVSTPVNQPGSHTVHRGEALPPRRPGAPGQGQRTFLPQLQEEHSSTYGTAQDGSWCIPAAMGLHGMDPGAFQQPWGCTGWILVHSSSHGAARDGSWCIPAAMGLHGMDPGAFQHLWDCTGWILVHSSTYGAARDGSWCIPAAMGLHGMDPGAFQQPWGCTGWILVHSSSHGTARDGSWCIAPFQQHLWDCTGWILVHSSTYGAARDGSWCIPAPMGLHGMDPGAFQQPWDCTGWILVHSSTYGTARDGSWCIPAAMGLHGMDPGAFQQPWGCTGWILVHSSSSDMEGHLDAQSPTNYLQGLDGRPIIAAPVFTKMLQDISASEGQLVVFECRVKGAPSPKVEWYREGTLIEDSPDFRILQKKPRSMAEPEEICTLVIAEVFSEDSGSFTCTASNKYGTVSSIARLTVKAPEDSSNAAALHTTSSIDFVATEHQAPPQTPPSHRANQTPKAKLEGVLVNHNEPRSSSKVGLRVHFKLPEDEKGSESSSEDGPGTTNQIRPNHFPEKINGQPMKIPEPTSPSKEPPPVLAKPKLDQSQLKQLHNQVLLEQQQVHQASLRELSFNTTLVNSATSFYQQSTSSLYKQSSASASQAFGYSRPKQLLPPPTPPPASPSASSSVTFSSIPQATQRTNVENFLGNPPPAPSRPSGGFTSKSEQSLPSPKESVVPPLTLSTCSVKQFQAQTVTPAPLSPTGRIQNPVAFLSAVLPSLPTAPSTNAMGLPRSTPATPTQGLTKKNLKPLPLATEDSIRENKVALVKDLERKLHFREDANQQSGQQEYRISSFEQRLMNEIEFRLERTPVDESDDEVQHEEIPTGKYIAPIFDKRLKHFRVMEGSPITFTCKIVGIPVPKVYWFKDGKQISKKNTHFKMNREEDGTCSLHIEAASNDDDGNYTIMAANPQVSGLPTPDLTWLLNGKPVLPDARHKMLVRETGVHSLLIDPLSQSDAGTYTCLATNKTGQNSFTLELTVVAKEVQRAPMFLEKLQNCGVPEGYPVRLEGRVVGMPPPVFYWKKDNETIPSNRERMSMHQDTTGYVCLLIQPAKKADAGWYTLSAKNEAGIVSCTARLDIYGTQKAPALFENYSTPFNHYLCKME